MIKSVEPPAKMIFMTKLTAFMIPCLIKLFTSRLMLKLSKLPIVETTMPGLLTLHLFLRSLKTSVCGVSSDSRIYLWNAGVSRFIAEKIFKTSTYQSCC